MNRLSCRTRILMCIWVQKKNQKQISKSYFVMQHYNETFLKHIIDVNFSIEINFVQKGIVRVFQINFCWQYEFIRTFGNILIKIPWRKYRTEIHSESIRTIPIHFDICIRANANNSEPIRKTFCISFDEKRLKINPTQSE